MISDWAIGLTDIVMTGYVVGVVLLLQVAIGKRWIRFKGRTHAKVHRWAAWVLVAIALGHAVLALAYVYGWRIFA